MDMGQTKTTSDQTTASKYPGNLLWSGVGCQVKIFGMASQQEVAHAPTHQAGLIARLVQPVQALQRRCADVLFTDAVFRR